MERWFDWSAKGWRRYLLSPEFVLPMAFVIWAWTLAIMLGLTTG